MQLSEFWKIFLKTTQYGSAIVALVLNFILILLIQFRSPPSLGYYKYLMLYMVMFQIAYSMLDAIAEPTILSCGPAFFVFRNFKRSVFGRNDGFSLLVVYCGFFEFSVAISAMHFIYRYGAINKKFRNKHLFGQKLIRLFLMPVIIGTLWGTTCAVFFRPDASTDLFSRSILLEAYDTRVEDISYMIALFYRLDKHDEYHPDPRIFFAIGCIWSLMGFSTFCVFYFGIKCYTQLSQALATTRLASRVAKSLQHQLLLALVVQTMIPVILMYTPAAVLYIFPMINVNVGLLGKFIAVTVAIYPAIDPLPTMFIVKNFRDTLLCRTCGSMQKLDLSLVQSPVDHRPAVFAPSVQFQLQRVNVI